MSSNSIFVRPFDPEDLERLHPRPAGQHSECPKTILTSAFTFLLAGEPIAICGGFTFIPGVVHFWGLMSERITERPLDFHKKCLEILRWYEETQGVRRMQIEVSVDYDEGQRWVRALGFTKEGRLKAWLPDGTDVYLYGRVKAWQ
jgi:hypothetical protein